MVKHRRCGLLVGVGVLMVLMAAALIGVLRGPGAGRASSAPLPVNHGAAQSTFGAVNAHFAVSVTQVRRSATIPSAPAPPTGLHYVSVQVSFQNDSQAQQRADPLDFQLIDALGNTHTPAFMSAPSPQCHRWTMADLYPNGPRSATPRDAAATQAGRSFGPQELCFTAGGDPSSPLTLIWDPDVSAPFFNSPTRIALQ